MVCIHDTTGSPWTAEGEFERSVLQEPLGSVRVRRFLKWKTSRMLHSSFGPLARRNFIIGGPCLVPCWDPGFGFNSSGGCPGPVRDSQTLSYIYLITMLFGRLGESSLVDKTRS